MLFPPHAVPLPQPVWMGSRGFRPVSCLHTEALLKGWGSGNTHRAVPSALEGWAQDKAKHHSTELWSREGFNAGPRKELDGLCPEQPKLPENSQQSPFLGKGRERGVSCCKRLGGRACVPEVRSRSGNDGPRNLHQLNNMLCSDKKGHGPQAKPSPSEVWYWLRGGKSQLAAPSGPGLQTPSSCHRRGSWAPRP